MSSLLDILNTVNNALADDSGFDLSELDKAVAEMHLKLTEPEWAIEDEALREECQKLVVQWAAQRYLDGVTDLELDKPLADTDVANPPTPTDTNTSFKEELEKLEVEFLHGVPVKLPPATITSIINLVDKEVIGSDQKMPPNSGMYPDTFGIRNSLRAEQRAIIRDKP
jgi:hypothetical protein